MLRQPPRPDCADARRKPARPGSVPPVCRWTRATAATSSGSSASPTRRAATSTTRSRRTRCAARTAAREGASWLHARARHRPGAREPRGDPARPRSARRHPALRPRRGRRACRLSGGDDLVSSMDDADVPRHRHREPDNRTGIYTLKNLLDVSLVAIPGPDDAGRCSRRSSTTARSCATASRCSTAPPPADDTLVDVQDQRQQFDTNYAALYHPWLTIPDPFPTASRRSRQYPIPPSGHVLGIYARIDNERGVHKAPANEVVRGITGLDALPQQGRAGHPQPLPGQHQRDPRLPRRTTAASASGARAASRATPTGSTSTSGGC